MTPEDEPKAPPATAQTAEESSADDVADDAMRALLKRSLDAKTAPAPAPSSSSAACRSAFARGHGGSSTPTDGAPRARV